MQELAQRRRLLERPLPKLNVGAATPKMPRLSLPATPTVTATSSECGSPRSSTAAAAVAPALLAGVVAARHDVEAEFARCRSVLDRAYSSVSSQFDDRAADALWEAHEAARREADQLAWEERERERRSSQLASWEEEDRAKWRAEERERQARMTALWDREEAERRRAQMLRWEAAEHKRRAEEEERNLAEKLALGRRRVEEREAEERRQHAQYEWESSASSLRAIETRRCAQFTAQFCAIRRNSAQFGANL